MPYPTAAQIRTRLAALTTGRTWCRIFSSSDPPATVPHLLPSVNGAEWTCLRIQKNPDKTKCLILGGVHANEWAPPPAVLSCFEALLAAYDAGTAITYGTFTVSNTQVRSIVDNVEIWVAPLVNPDGHAASHAAATSDQLTGRKNGRHVATHNPGAGHYDGVNVNRNFNVVWDYQLFYAPTHEDSPTATLFSDVHSSKTATDPDYIGTAAESEPETRNVKTLMDQGARFFMDCHMYGPDLLYSWGIEENQTTDPLQNFRNSAFNHLRDGLTGSGSYREYIPSADLTEFSTLAGTIVTAINNTSMSSSYHAQPGSLGTYATSGASDDYAYSRHFVTSSLPRVVAFTLEAGSGAEGGHHPTFSGQYPKIEKEIHAAILSLLAYVSTWVAPTATTTTSTGTTTSTPESGNGRCFLSRLFGSLLPTLAFLYDLRDVRFRESARGRRFIAFVERIYAVVSPPAARFIDRHARLRNALARYVFGPAVTMLRVASGVAVRLRTPELRVDALIVATLLIAITGAAMIGAASAAALWLLLAIVGGAHA